jgi:hypothetical protein
MIEFFISKLWALVSALAVLGVVVTCINGAVHVAVDQSREEAFQNLVDSLGAMDESSQGHVQLALSDVLNEDEELRMGGGIIELIGSDHHFMRTLPVSVTLYGRDGAVLTIDQWLSLTSRSTLLIDIDEGQGGTMVRVYEAKTFTILSTQSTNFLTSISLL